MARRPVATVVSATVAGSLLLLTAACGGDESTAAQQQPMGAESTSPAPSESPSPVESETPTPSPSPTTPPLSRFEDQPPVVAARAWAAAIGRSINKRQRDLATAKRLMTPAGRERFPRYAAEDFGLYYPGPQPFTPTEVTVHGKQAAIELCWWSQGFAQDRKTKLPARKRSIDPARLVLKKKSGRWLVDDLAAGSGSCSSVPVKGVGW